MAREWRKARLPFASPEWSGRACEQTGQRVAILIDEYDKPMLQAIGNKALQNEFRNTLKPFYGVLKTMDGCIQFALLTGGHQVRQGQRVQRPQQPERHLHGPAIPCPLRCHRRRAAPRIRPKHPAAGAGAKHDLRGNLPTLAERLRRLPLHTQLHRNLQPFQPAQHLRQAGVRQLLVRDGHPHLSGGTAETQPLQPGGDGPCRNLRRRAEQHLWRRRPTARHLPKRIPHD